jgi:hypothetical protein
VTTAATPPTDPAGAPSEGPEGPAGGPLAGVTVVALEQAVAVPFTTRQLADLGARVVKIERPGGDFARDFDRTVHGQSSYFVWLNRGKQSVVLDLTEPADLAALTGLVATADVFVQNLKPGVAERFGLGAASLRARYPRLITCSVSGYGTGGPYAAKKAYDLLVQCEAGLLSVTGTAAQRDLADPERPHRPHGRGRRRGAGPPGRVGDPLDQREVRAGTAVGDHRRAVDGEELGTVAGEQLGALDQPAESGLGLGRGLVLLAQRGEQEAVAVRHQPVEIERGGVQHPVRVDPADQGPPAELRPAPHRHASLPRRPPRPRRTV